MTDDSSLIHIKRVPLAYYEKYLGKGKKIVLMGIGFDPGKRNIGNYLLESL